MRVVGASGSSGLEASLLGSSGSDGSPDLGGVTALEASAVQINGRGVAIRRLADGRGLDMPDWHGCRTLGQREYLLLGDGPDSFDGRYFGPTGRNDIIGKAHRL